MIHKLAGFLRALLLLLPVVAHSADYPPANHGGTDLVLANGDRIWGEHLNVKNFVVPTTATVEVHHYYPTIPHTGILTIRADYIDIRGILDAEGAGYTGGGGTGGHGVTSSDGVSGADGKDGQPRYLEYDSNYNGHPMQGDGPARGIFAGFDKPEMNGGYNIQNGNTDETTNTLVWMGSGGAGTAGSYGFTPPPPICSPSWPPIGGKGGAGGGPGGGAVMLFASKSLSISGKIYTMGATGSGGGSGSKGYTISGQGTCTWSSANGGGGGSGDARNSGNDGAGSGAGGGVLLYCEEADAITLLGTLDARSSRWRLALDPGAFTSGGTIKVFYSGKQPSSDQLLGGRIFMKDLTPPPTPTPLAMSGWVMTGGGTAP